MFVMTAKVDKKAIAIVAAAVAALILLFVLVFGGGKTQSTGNDISINTNDDRISFLASHGWEVVTSPVETSQVRIPQNTSEVFARYNALQKSQGYDLSTYAGKTVMRYVYKINNYPGSTEPVYATLLIYKDQVIGGDITDTAAKGAIRGFKMPQSSATPTSSATE